MSETTYQSPEPEEPDPTAIEPDEASLPDKPPVPGLPSDAELEQEDEPGQEDVPEHAFLNPAQARLDDTVDDSESDEG